MSVVDDVTQSGDGGWSPSTPGGGASLVRRWRERSRRRAMAGLVILLGVGVAWASWIISARYHEGVASTASQQELPLPTLPAPAPPVSATGPVTPAPPARSQEQPRESTTIGGPDHEKARQRKHAEHGNGRRNIAQDENMALRRIDKSLVEESMRESKANMESCYNRAIQHGGSATVKVQFLVERNGTVTLLKVAVTGDNAEVSMCAETFVGNIRNIKFSKFDVPSQGFVSLSYGTK